MSVNNPKGLQRALFFILENASVLEEVRNRDYWAHQISCCLQILAVSLTRSLVQNMELKIDQDVCKSFVLKTKQILAVLYQTVG